MRSGAWIVGPWLLAAACTVGDDVPAADETSLGEAPEAAEPPSPSPDPAAPPAGATAEFMGDPTADELALLDVSQAEARADDFLLALPGSEGIDVAGAAEVALVGGESIGTPQGGRLLDGIQLPYAPGLYTRRNPARAYGSAHTIRTLQRAFTTLRHDRQILSEVIVGDLSLPGGGWFPPHVSHRSGRDIDIRLVLAPGLDRETLPTSAADVDWDAVWALVHAFLETGEVEYVFLGWSRQAHLYEAGLRAGVHRRVLDRWFQWPDRGDPEALIRHEDGHLGHVHIRLACGPADGRCQGR